MNKAVEEYHLKRRTFIIIPNLSLIIGDVENGQSHTELLQSMGLPENVVREIIENNPRGYFLDNKLVIYQSDNIKEGEAWALREENYPEVKRFYPELKRVFQINSNTKIFLGVLRGKPGVLWDVINEVDVTFFDK